jgi:signal transduction histidine kinase
MEQFAAHCAHDVNNFLTGILGNLELMQNRARRNQVKDYDAYLESARNAAGRATRFAERLLAYSGRAGNEPEAVQVNQLVTELLAVPREPPAVPELAADAGAAFCDPAQLEAALLELLANAEVAAGPSGKVGITTARQGARVAITVTDNGAGMSPAVLARAAEPFFTTRPNSAGRGLGLAVVARFARQAGGALAIESAPGAGTAAQLTLPGASP